MLKYLLVLLFLLSLCPRSFGQGTPPILSPADAAAYSISNNPDLKAARVAIRVAEARALDAGKLENPELSVGAASDFAFNAEGEYGWSVGLEQQFPVTGRLRLLRNAARDEIRVARAEIREAERQLAFKVESACDALLATDARLDLLHEQIRLNERFMQFLESKVARAEASRMDVNQLRVTVEAIRQQTRSKERERKVELAKLRAALSVPQSRELDIRPTTGHRHSPPPIPEFGASDLANHPEYQLKSRVADLAASETSVARARRWEDLAVEIFFEQERSVDAPAGLERERFLGVGFSIPLPVHRSNRGEIEARKTREHQMALEVEALAFQLRTRTAALRNAAKDLRQQIDEYESNVLLIAEENLEQMEAAYGSGQIDLTTLFRAQDQRLELQTTLLDLRAELADTATAWRFLAGRNLPAAHRPSK